MRKERLFGEQNGVREDKQGIMDVVKKGHFGTQQCGILRTLYKIQSPNLNRELSHAKTLKLKLDGYQDINKY